MGKVFVYGTLMRGRSNYKYYLEHSIFLGIGTIQGYALYDLGFYPGIILDENECTKGEVFEVDNETMSRLDRLEGEGDLYLRRLVKVEMDNGLAHDAYVYVWNARVNIERKVDFVNQPWMQEERENKKMKFEEEV
ncbi:gamma-glutamylcyclotransferase [Clostridium sp. CF012]|uniref:gamma-glutamylcyclotransferase family protein n=1 Tax=Clostridium sp. CF012 TaxID=2843319 RepID=UPI0025B78356|nr:gamma-glutamylcyclotransferase family protein [Clostridium sp. CF012]